MQAHPFHRVLGGDRVEVPQHEIALLRGPAGRLPGVQGGADEEVVLERLLQAARAGVGSRGGCCGGGACRCGGRCRILAEAQLLEEVVERLLPLRRVVRAVGDVPDVRYVVRLEMVVQVAADPEQAVAGAAGKPEQLQLPRHRGIGHQFGGLAGVRRGGEAADPGKGVRVAEAEVERLAAAHREPRDRPVRAFAADRVARLDRRDQVVQQVALEHREGRRGLEHVARRPVVLLRAAVGHDHDHRHRLAVGDQVVEHGAGPGEALPLGFVAADAVQQVEDGVLPVRGKAGRGVNVRLAPGADGFRVVFDHFQLPLGDARARLVPAVRRRRESGLVVLPQFDRLAGGDSRFLARCRALGLLGEGQR